MYLFTKRTSAIITTHTWKLLKICKYIWDPAPGGVLEGLPPPGTAAVSKHESGTVTKQTTGAVSTHETGTVTKQTTGAESAHETGTVVSKHETGTMTKQTTGAVSTHETGTVTK